MASTYAAIGVAAPSQAEFAAFADAMSTSYGAPIELVSVDPGSGQQTELADTSITNLLAELPVLETTANGVNLGLRLADGTQVRFASTARLADFLYATAVQQMQATSFVTDNFNLDVQWLNTVDQPLLNEAVWWNEHATALRALGGANYDQQAVEANTLASLALQIAAQPPASRQNLTVTIANPVAGNPTQVTAYAGGGGSIHDTTPGIGTYIESVISLGLNIAAAVSGQAYLYFAAAAVDAARSGQAFSNGQDLQGLLTLAQAVAAGITGGAGETAPGTPAPVSAQVLNAAAQGVGGVYGAVQSAANGNAAGILAGALEAAAAGAAGIGLSYGGQTQTALNLISAALGSAGIATNMASDFASGNLGQGLLDSLNLFLPAVAQAFANTQSNQSALRMNSATFQAASANPASYVSIPDFGGIVAAAENAPTILTSGIGSSGVTETVVPVAAGDLTNVDASSGGTGAVVTQSGQTYVVAATPTNSGDTIQAMLSGMAGDLMSFLAYINPISPAEAATPQSVPATSATASPGIVTYTNSDGSQTINTGGSAAWRDNNPGNMIAGAGAYQPIGMNLYVPGTAAIFPDFQTGWNALIANLQTTKYGILSVQDAINAWVGNGVQGSNPPLYVSHVVSWTGLSPNTVLNTLTPTQLKSLGSAIMRQEGYIPGTVILHAP